MNFKVGRFKLFSFKLFLKQTVILAVLLLNIPFPFLAHSMFVELPEVPGSHVKVKVFQSSSQSHHLQEMSKELKEACLHNQTLLTTLTQGVGLGQFYFEPIEDFSQFLSEAEPMLLLHEILGSPTILPFQILSLTSIQEGKTEEKFVKASPMIRGTKLSRLKDVIKENAWKWVKSINPPSFSDVFLISLLMNSLHETGDNLLIDQHRNLINLTVPLPFFYDESRDPETDQNILYCLTPLMTQRVTGHVYECLKSLHPEVLALRWFTSFSADGHSSFLPGETGAFLNRVDKLHKLLNYSPNISHNGIFQEFSPERSKIYKGAIEQAETMSKALEKVRLAFNRSSRKQNKLERYPLSERIHEIIDTINLYTFKDFLSYRLEILNRVAAHFFEAGKLCQHESWHDINIIDEVLCYPLPLVTVKLLMALRPSPIALEIDKVDLENQQIKGELTTTKKQLSAKDTEIKELSDQLKLLKFDLEQSKNEEPLKKVERKKLKGTGKNFKPHSTATPRNAIKEKPTKKTHALPQKVTQPPIEKLTPSKQARLIAETLSFLVKEVSWKTHRLRSIRAYSVTFNCPYLKTKKYTVYEKQNGFGQDYFEWEDEVFSFAQYVNPKDLRKTLAVRLKQKDITYYRQQRFEGLGFKREGMNTLVDVYFDSKYQVEYWQESTNEREPWEEKWTVEAPTDFSKAYFSSRREALAHVKRFAKVPRVQEIEGNAHEPHLFSPPDMIEAYWGTPLEPEKPSLLKTLAMGYLIISPGYLYGLKTFFESWSSDSAKSEINESAVSKPCPSFSQDCVVHNRGGADDCAAESAEEVFKHWHTRAEENKDPEAQNRVAQMYFFGQGVPQNHEKAFEWTLKAANQRFAIAEHNLGMQYYNGVGAPQNIKEAIKWITLAANQDLPEAQFRLGFFYFAAEGVPQDYDKAVNFFQKAASEGLPEAQNYLGFCYFSGYGVTKSFGKARKWYLKAAEQNHAHAHYMIGWLYEHNLGVYRDYEKARQSYQKAAALGHGWAREKLKELK